MELRGGDRVGRYVVLDVLGEGGMSVVYRAKDTTLEREIALKVLRRQGDDGGAPGSRASTTGTTSDSGGVSTRELAARMFKEARAAAALAHTNAVAVYEFGEEGGHVFIAMELVKGRSVRDLMQEPGVPIAEKIRWLVEVAEVLAVAHDNGIVHRDVKPENIMVRRDGLVKVLDFGVAKRVRYAANKGDPDQSAETAAGTLLGTPHYMSPEQLRGNPVDGRSDQFAWGVVAYEVLAGQMPWPETTDGMALVLAIVEEVPPLLTPERVPQLPADVGAIVAKALAKDREDRFPTMAHVALALAPHAAPAPPVPTSAVSLGTLPNVTTNPTARLVVPGGARALWLPGLAAALAGAALVVGATFAFVPRMRSWAPPVLDAAASVPAKPPWFEDVVEGTHGSVAAAREPYRRGVLAFRAGTFEGARRGFLDALALDPTFVAAKLRLAALESMLAGDGAGDGRRYLRDAHQGRERLSPGDQGLLAALEPWIQNEPPDLLDAERQLDALAATAEGTPEHRFYLGLARMNRGAYHDAARAFDAVLEEDPAFAPAFAVKVQAEAYQGNMAGASRAIEQCISVVPASTDCLFAKIVIEEANGECRAMELDTRTWLGHAPADNFGYSLLVKSLAAQGRPRAEIDALLSADAAANVAGYTRLALTFAEGNLTAVIGEARARLAGAKAGADRELRQILALMLVEALREAGRRNEAIALARQYLAEEDAWGLPAHVEDSAILLDPVPRLVGILADLGSFTAKEVERQRGQWIQRWRKRTPEALHAFVWVGAYGDMTTDQASALQALAELDRFGGIPAFMPVGNGALRVGSVLARAGRFDEALPYLQRGTASCSYTDAPVRFLEGWLLLADTHAARGELDLACEALARAIARWPNPRPRSVTMETIRQRRRELRCER